AVVASELGALQKSVEVLKKSGIDTSQVNKLCHDLKNKLGKETEVQLSGWDSYIAKYKAPELTFKVRAREVKLPLYYETLSHLQIPKVAVPLLSDWGDRLRFLRKENF